MIEGDWLDDGVNALRALIPVELQNARSTAVQAAVPKDMILDDSSSPFGQLDAETTLLIFKQLPLRDQLTTVIAVHPGWRALRNTLQSPLFTELNMLIEHDTLMSGAFHDPAFACKTRVVDDGKANNSKWLSSKAGGGRRRTKKKGYYSNYHSDLCEVLVGVTTVYRLFIMYTTQKFIRRRKTFVPIVLIYNNVLWRLSSCSMPGGLCAARHRVAFG